MSTLVSKPETSPCYLRLVLILPRCTCFTQHNRAETGNQEKKGGEIKENVALSILSCANPTCHTCKHLID